MRIVSLPAALAVCLVVQPSLARADDVWASATGSVRGPDGARLPGAIVVFISEDTGAEWRVVTGSSGLFRVARLIPGQYVVVAELEGFEPWRVGNVTLDGGGTFEVDIELELATLREEVDVVGGGPRDTLELSAFREFAAKDVADAIDRTPGMSRLRKGALAGDIVLRGVQGRDLTVLIDGQRVQGACPNQMDPPAFHVDLAEVQRVEIGKGPFDVRNQGSVGGVVNIVTQRPGRGWHGLLNLAAGSHAYVNPSATASVGGATVAALVGASFRRGDVYEDGRGRKFTTQANYRPDATTLQAFGAGTAWTRLAWSPGSGQTLQLSYTRQDTGTVLYPYLQMDGIDDNADRAGLRYELADGPGAWQEIAAQAYFTQVEHWMTDRYRLPSATAPRDYSMATNADTATWGARLEGRWRGIATGAEMSRQRWSTATLLGMRQYVAQQSLAEAAYDAVGFYAEGSRSLGTHTALELGARVDGVTTSVRDTGLNTALFRAYHGVVSTRGHDFLPSGKARVVWQPSSAVTVAAGLGRTGRAPDQQERYFALSRMGTDWVGNPTLDPTANTGIEVEVDVVRRGVRVALSGFAWWLDDFIVVREVTRQAMGSGGMNNRARSFANVDAFMRGFEASASLPLSNRLALSGSLAFVRGDERGAPGGPLAEIPPAGVHAALRYDDGRLAVALEARAAARQDRVDGTLGEQPTPGYVVASARTTFRHRGLSFVLGVDNLLDRTYYEHLSYQRDPFRSGARVFEPGRTLHLNVAFGF